MTDIDAGQGAGGAAAAALASPPVPAYFEAFQDAGVKEWAGKSGFKTTEDLAKHAQKFDAFKDADPASLVASPKADDFNAQVKFNRERFGAPEDGKAYALDAIEGVDKDMAGAAQSWFSEAGLSPAQARFIAEKQMAWAKTVSEKLAGDDKAASDREMAQLKTEWPGDQYKTNTELGRRAMRTAAEKAGVSAEDTKQFLDYIESGAGARVAMKISAFFGGLMKESDFIDGKGGAAAPNRMEERWYKPAT